MFGSAIILFPGCGPAVQAPVIHTDDSPGLVSTTHEIKKPLVVDCLNDFFTGRFSHGEIYIQASEFVPSDLTQAGEYKVTVISDEKLIQTFAGSKVAPIRATINLYEHEPDPPDHFHIAINYTALDIDGATNIPLGHGADYEYRFEGDSAVLVDKNVEKE